jgi:AcrR family transcriptional regulator/predicted DNA-binding protein (MmcQ/YjbR family)
MTPTARPRAPKGRGGLLRDEILEAAERLLIETGSEEAVSIRAVADAVGVTPPSIYRHFDDKQLLLFEVCARHFASLEEVARSATEGIEDPVEALTAMGRAYVRFGLDQPAHYRIMFMGRSDLTPEQYADEVLAGGGPFALLVGAVRRCLEAGGAADAERNPVTVALLVWAGVHGLTSLLIAKPGMPWGDVERITGEQCRAIVRGVLGVDPGPLAGTAISQHTDTRMQRLEAIVAELPEAERVDVAEWGDHPTFRVRNKSFVFSDQEAGNLSLKLPREEAAAVVATDGAVEPAGYGLGRHGWIALSVPADADVERWQQITEWVRTSYTLVAPKRLARLVLDEDGLR